MPSGERGEDRIPSVREATVIHASSSTARQQEQPYRQPLQLRQPPPVLWFLMCNKPPPARQLNGLTVLEQRPHADGGRRTSNLPPIVDGRDLVAAKRRLARRLRVNKVEEDRRVVQVDRYEGAAALRPEHLSHEQGSPRQDRKQSSQEIWCLGSSQKPGSSTTRYPKQRTGVHSPSYLLSYALRLTGGDAPDRP